MRKNKIKFITAIVICLTSIALFAKEPIDPELIVKGAIRSAQNNDLSGMLFFADLVAIASQPRHSRQPEELVEFFKGIELDKIKFERKEYSITGDKILVRILEPISCDFELEMQETRREDGRIGYKYCVTYVHP